MSGEVHDVVIVGSGFGGSLSALRLAEAGRSVLVLERGRRWQPANFPRDTAQVDDVLWRHDRRRSARGLYDVRFLKGAGTVVASGVGGGSLIYANIHIRPDESVFDDARWPRTINRKTLDPYYDRVAALLGVSPLPPEFNVRKRTAIRAAAAAMGREIFDPDQAVAWRDAPGPGRSACVQCAECEFGCRYGAKNTLDLTVLARAEEKGARVRPGIVVRTIRPAGRDGWTVDGEEAESGRPFSATGRRVILAAGTLGTNELLMRSRHQGTLSGLSHRLGYGYSGNGDFLGSVMNCREDLEPWHGPDVTSVMRFPSPDIPFTLAAPSFNRPVMEAITAMGQPRLTWLRPLAFLLWPALNWMFPIVMKKRLLDRPPPPGADPARATNLFAIGRDNAGGRLTWKRGRLRLHWDYARENRQLIEAMEKAMQATAAALGGTYGPLASWSAFRRILTVHSLGGCALSDSRDRGVVSPEGEVHGCPGLYVADGSVIPAAIGYHPAMTISAVAARIADAVAASF